MKTNDDLQRELISRIVRHLPSSKQKAGANQFREGRSFRYAAMILLAYHKGPEVFGISNHKENLKHIVSHATRLIGAISNLPDNGRFWLSKEMESSSEVSLVQMQDQLRQLVYCSRTVLSYPRSEIPASKKANETAAAVAKACRRIWGEETWWQEEKRLKQAEWYYFVPQIPISPTPDWHARRTASKSKKLEKYLSFVEDCAPRQVHNDRPSAFGQFLQEVLDCLNISSKSGEPVRAASALQRLAKHGCQEKPEKK